MSSLEGSHDFIIIPSHRGTGKQLHIKTRDPDKSVLVGLGTRAAAKACDSVLASAV